MLLDLTDGNEEPYLTRPGRSSVVYALHLYIGPFLYLLLTLRSTKLLHIRVTNKITGPEDAFCAILERVRNNVPGIISRI